MKRKKRKRQKRIHKQSIARNVALLFLSLGLLAGISMLFTSFSNRSELSMDPLQSTVKGLVARDEKPQVAAAPAQATAPAKKTEAAKSTAVPFDYSFYKILNHKNSTDQAEEQYTVQIASFKSQAHARSLVQELRGKNRIKCRIDKEGSIFCVRWGTFTTVSSAEESRVKLTEKTKRDCRVVKM